MQQQDRLTPVVVLGTGFNRQLLPTMDHKSDDDHQLLKPLVDWQALLRETAMRSGALAAHNPYLCERPTLFWDELVRCQVALQSGASSPQAASRTELQLKKEAAGILAETVQHARQDSLLKTGLWEEFWAAAPTDIVSLNFDTLVLGNLKATVRSPGKDEKAPYLLEADSKRVWYPHGCIKRPQTIRLGLRDYGFAPENWTDLINDFKGHQRELGNAGGRTSTKRNHSRSRSHHVMVRRLLDNKLSRDQAYIGRLLLAPLIFFGAGLSRDEWGWWWLLNQRARNLARVQESDRPPTVIIKSSRDPEAAFWASSPAGVRTLFVDDWQSGWQVLLKWLQDKRNWN
jgi:hypothetical protein